MAAPVLDSWGAVVWAQDGSFSDDLEVPYPATVNAGDFLIIHAGGATDDLWSAPSGFTLIRAHNNSNAGASITYGKVAAGTESGTVTLPIGTTAHVHGAQMFRVTGGDTVENADSRHNVGSKIITHDPIIADAADRLMLAFTSINDDEPGSSFTSETGGDLTLTHEETTTIANDHHLSVQEDALTASGTISGGSWSFQGASEQWQTIVFAVYKFVAPSWDQDSYRFRNDDGTEVTATWMAAANTKPADIDLDTNFRLRFLVQSTVLPDPIVGPYWSLQFRQNAGSWTTIDDAGGTAQPVKASSTVNVTDNSALVQRLGSGTMRGSRFESSHDETLNNTSVAAVNDEYEVEYCLQFNSTATTSASAGDTFDFRLQYSPDGGTTAYADLGSYTNTATVDVASSGTTTPKTLSVTATGTPGFSTTATFSRTLAVTASGAVGFLRNIGVTKAVAALGTVGFIKNVGLIKSVTATGAAALSKVRMYAKTLAVAATGAPGFTRIATFPRTFAVAATGTPALSRVTTFLRTLSVNATGAVGFLRNIGVTKSVAATGTPGFSSALFYTKLLSVVATGAPAFSRVLTAAVTSSATALGTAAYSRVVTFSRTLAVAATGTPALARTISVTKQVTATGAAALTKVTIWVRTFAVTATGTVGFNAEKILALIQRTFSVTATGTPGFSTLTTFAKTLPVVATGAAALARTISLTKTVVTLGTAGHTKIKTAVRTFSVTATGTPGFTGVQLILRSFAVVATGTASLTRQLTFGKTLSVVATGTAALSKFAVFVTTHAVNALGSAALSTVTTIFDTYSVIATGTASLTRKMFKTVSATATGTPGFSSALVIPKLLAAVATGLANSTQTFIAGVGPSLTGIRHLVHVAWQHVSHKLTHLLTHHDGEET